VGNKQGYSLDRKGTWKRSKCFNLQIVFLVLMRIIVFQVSVLLWHNTIASSYNVQYTIYTCNSNIMLYHLLGLVDFNVP